MERKRYSPKRDAILRCLRSTSCHPSAEWVYSQLKPEIPDLSLATVYRNLARFRAEGEVQVIGCVDGEDRYDGNTAPTGEDTSGWKIFLKKRKKPLYKSEWVCYYTNANNNC